MPFTRVPNPSSLHEYDNALLTLASLTVNASLWQVSAVADPAFATGLAVTVNNFVSAAATVQLPLPVTVSVKVTIFPASPATGV